MYQIFLLLAIVTAPPADGIYPRDRMIEFDATHKTGTTFWLPGGPGLHVIPYDNGRKVHICGTPGTHMLMEANADPEGKAWQHFYTIGIMEGGPDPAPDPEPGPTPPTPDPTPDPTPTPAPIPEAGFRVLIVYESSEMTKYPIETQVILAGADVREYLRMNCVKEGTTPGFRIYDADIDTTHDSKVWQAAMARPRAQIPWLILSNGKTGYEGPLPKTPTEFLDLCKKYAR